MKSAVFGSTLKKVTCQNYLHHVKSEINNRTSLIFFLGGGGGDFFV